MLIDALFFLVGTIHVLIAPFTKVEESFNLHATHDILMYGILPTGLKNVSTHAIQVARAISKTQQYDHFVFPGVVPRSFVGSITLAYFSTPVLLLLQALGLLKAKFDIQLTGMSHIL
jgi:alpha-1,6-mannosyltransferase